MGCTVFWEPDVQRVKLTSGGDPSVLKLGEVPPLNEEELSVWNSARDNGIEVQIRPDIVVELDGVVQEFHNAGGTVVYPAVYRQMVYLPIGQMSGLVPVWVPDDGLNLEAIYLHSGLSEQEAADIRAFVTQGTPIADAVAVQVEQLLNGTDHSNASARAQFEAIEEQLNALWDLPRPTAPCAAPFVERLNLYLRETGSAIHFHLAQMDSGLESFAEMQSGLLLYSEMVSGVKNFQSTFSGIKNSVPEIWGK